MEMPANDNNPNHLLVDLCSEFGKPKTDLHCDVLIRKVFDNEDEMNSLCVE